MDSLRRKPRVTRVLCKGGAEDSGLLLPTITWQPAGFSPVSVSCSELKRRSIGVRCNPGRKHPEDQNSN